VEQFDAASYSIVVTRTTEDGETFYFGYVAELPDISSYGEAYDEVYENCLESLQLLYEDAVAQGKTFPAPQKTPDISAFSGRVTLRMSRSMHAEISRCAAEDGVSLNSWVVEAIAQRRGYYVTKKQPISKLFTSVFSPLYSLPDTELKNHPGLQLSSSEERYLQLHTQVR